MLYVGRYLSLIFDLGTVLLVYKIAGLLFKNKKVQFYSAFFYAVAFFPIQNSHFFVVDVFLTFFTTFLVFLLFTYLSLPSPHGRGQVGTFQYSLMISMMFAAMLATKFTAVIFYPIIISVLIYKKFVDKQLTIQQLAINLIIFHFSLFTFNFLFMPYAFIENKKFIADISAQIKMNSDPYIFPYTLQYVGTLPYLYYLKNIFFWGLGPVIFILSTIGILLNFPVILSEAKNLALRSFRNLRFTRSFVAFAPQDDLRDKITNCQLLITFLFYLFYFLIVGRSAVKFMRYMLPIYPFLAIMAGYGFFKMYSFFCHPELARPSKSEGRSGISGSGIRCRNKFGMTILTSIVIATLIWSLMFLNIYSQKHSRIAATEWILQNIPKGSTIALEHWDDGLPLTGGENYRHVELTLYDQPDDDNKWFKLNEKLRQADYIIIASNRLYVPLQKLTDCRKYKSCYPKTAEYYRRLFNNQNVILASEERARPESNNDSGQAGMTEVRFKKVAEFTVYPQLSINNYQLTINDDSADESFTVYDHPKIMIFKKI